MLFKSKKPKRTYDSERPQSVLRCSICTGERVAGFRDVQTGKIVEIALIRTDKELEEFMETYGICEITKVY